MTLLDELRDRHEKVADLVSWNETYLRDAVGYSWEAATLARVEELRTLRDGYARLIEMEK